MALTRKAQEIADSISRDRRALLGSVRDLAPEQTDFRIEPGSWSIDDVLHHLALTEEASSKLMGLFQKRAGEESIGPDPSPAGSVLGSIDSLVEGADDEKAPAPDRVMPRSKVEASAAIARLEAARARILTSVEALAVVDGTRLTYRHPFFGELDLYQWLLIGGWHERRHTRQIERIKTSSAFPHS
ncbi:MAG TPA: DinB family protein [Vicinamibacteria bacterium]|jgi:DinB superfamily|nr:DinB family protein [Vicinamibacteria bacterium]